VFTASKPVLEALFERAEWFAEMLSALWGEGMLKPCWRLHNDVMIWIVGLERAWKWACDPEQKNLNELHFWYLKLENVKNWIKHSSMNACLSHHIFPEDGTQTDLAAEIDNRRSLYSSPIWRNQTINAASFPSFDAAGRPLGYPENRLPYDGARIS
jgi:hypothetical protein